MISLKQLVPLTSAARRRRTLALIVGDACIFVIFAAVGRDTHHEAAGIDAFWQVVATAAPFALGWFIVAPFLGVYRESVTANVRTMLKHTALGWVCAWPVAMVLRGLFRQEIPPLSFALVVLIMNLLFLCVWRGLFVLVAKRGR
ncbi:MAG TPA: DUF3054 domain-containing protein [Ktedonobacterales bacterium]|nr:DUF3054 domain-containing protein [Ktedonobacterales bacterium]